MGSMINNNGYEVTDRVMNELDDLRSRLAESEKKRRHVEETLANIDEFNLSILDSLPANIAVLDEFGTIIYVNKSWVQFAHENNAYSDDSIGVGINYFNVCETASGEHSDEAPNALEGMLKVLNGELDHFEFEYPCHSPRKDRWFLMYVTPFSSHKKYGIVVTHIDITSRVMAERSAEDAKKRNEIYVDLMSHDINNMNQVAMGYLELALSLQNFEEAKGLISKSMESLARSSRLIDTVRKIQKIRSKSLKEYEVDICNILQDLRKQYASVPGRHITINFMPISGCHVVANELILDVFSNLISNAIKHSDQNKPLDINMSVTKVMENGREYNKVSVEDNGSGIPDEIKAKLFTRFQRGQTKANGQGLGLYLVKTLVDDFHGKVWVEDRVPGDHTKGTRFVVMLSAAEK